MKLATEEAAQVKAAEEAAIVVTQAEEAVHLPDEHHPLLLFEVSVLPPQLPSLPPLQSPERVSGAEKAIVDATQKPSFPPSSAAVAHEDGHRPPLAPAPGLPPLSAADHQGGHCQRRKGKQPIKKKVRVPSDQPSPLDSFAATNNSSTRQSPSTPSRLMSTPLIRESPMLDRAVGALLARRPGAAGQTVDKDLLASCSQTQPSRQPCQVPWQLCDIGHVSCWAVAQQQMARSGGGQLIPGLNYQRFFFFLFF